MISCFMFVQIDQSFLGCILFFQRFALAAVELNGVLYATGGYDGNDYLK